jgi:hypothetical protein
MIQGLMRGYRAAWLVTLPLAVASWLGAHCLAYWLVSPDGAGHMGLHHDRGHAYLGYTPALAVWALTLLVAGLLLCVGEGLKGRRPSRPPVRLFVLLPPLGFAIQEHLERLIGTGGIPSDLVLEPTFIAGIALQLPFALAALLVAHALNTIGFGIGRVVARRLAFARPVPGAPPTLLRLPESPIFLALSVLAPGHGPRAPPAGVHS